VSLLLSKALSQLLLPPGILVVMGAAGLIFHRKIWGRMLIGFSLLLLWLLATEPVRNAILEPLENSYSPIMAGQVAPAGNTAIVLLGGGLYDKAPEFAGVDMLSHHSLMRTVYAAELARATGYEVYATGGIVLDGDLEPEGTVMQRWLERLGVEPALIHAEISAQNTWENAANIKVMLKERGITQLMLVTSAWHMPRAMMVFESMGLQPIPAPCDYLSTRGGYDLRSYLPRGTVFSDSYFGLHEYLGLVWYRLKMML